METDDDDNGALAAAATAAVQLLSLFLCNVWSLSFKYWIENDPTF